MRTAGVVLLALLVLLMAIPMGMAMAFCPYSMAACPAGLAFCAALLGLLLAVEFLPLAYSPSRRRPRMAGVLFGPTLERPPQA